MPRVFCLPSSPSGGRRLAGFDAAADKGSWTANDWDGFRRQQTKKLNTSTLAGYRCRRSIRQQRSQSISAPCRTREHIVCDFVSRFTASHTINGSLLRDIRMKGHETKSHLGWFYAERHHHFRWCLLCHVCQTHIWKPANPGFWSVWCPTRGPAD